MAFSSHTALGDLANFKVLKNWNTVQCTQNSETAYTEQWNRVNRAGETAYAEQWNPVVGVVVKQRTLQWNRGTYVRSRGKHETEKHARTNKATIPLSAPGLQSATRFHHRPTLPTSIILSIPSSSFPHKTVSSPTRQSVSISSTHPSSIRNRETQKGRESDTKQDGWMDGPRRKR